MVGVNCLNKMQRYFANNDGNVISFTDDDIHHIVNVLRMKCGDQLEVVVDDLPYLAKIASLNPFSVTIIKQLIDTENKDVNITLLYCLPKGDKLDLVVAKAVEIGVDNIIVITSKNTIVKWTDETFNKKKHRYQKIIKEAAMVSKRSRLPTFNQLLSFKQALNIPYDLKIIANEHNRGDKIFNINLHDARKIKSIALIIGAEGGFTNEEIEQAINKGYIPVSLGNNILKTETAAIVALAMLKYWKDHVNL
jgi:16S rRNA (uracil1498-N3)-methyltransferase